MSRIIECLNCGAPFSEAVSPCKWCGGTIHMSISLVGDEIKSAIGQIGTVVETSSEDEQCIKYISPAGAQSNSSLTGHFLTISVKPPIDIGRRGESRVLACIKNNLIKVGKNLREPQASEKAKDNRGEDGVLIIDEHRIVLQIVTIRPDENFWRNVAKGEGVANAEISEVLKWINNTISNKAKLYENSFKLSMLLAIDVGHMGVIASELVGSLYIDAYGDPTIQYGFGGIWLIGPIENNIFILGKSRW